MTQPALFPTRFRPCALHPQPLPAPTGTYCSSCQHPQTRSSSTALPACTKRIECSHPRATPAPAPSCTVCTGQLFGCQTPLPSLWFALSRSRACSTSRCSFQPSCSGAKETPDQGKWGGHQGLLWSPANRNKMGRSCPPNVQTAIGVDHPINCEGAQNGRARRSRQGAQEATCKASSGAEPVAPGVEQAEVALVSPGHGCS